MNYPITRTKVILPRRQGDLLSRQRLLVQLDDLLDYRLALITAPAGYGKTSLLVDHAARVEYPVCWLALDPLDQDPLRFIHYFLAAIRGKFPDFGETSHSLASEMEESELASETLVATIVNDLYEHVREHFLLVLDDFHLVQNSPLVTRFINDFSQAMDENCHLAIASRSLISLPDLPLMVGRAQVKGLSFEELAFLPAEIQDLYRVKYGQEVDRGKAEELALETEGWITGLLLTAESTRGGLAEQARAIRAAGVDLYDYLAQQVLEGLSPELQDFLLRTSVLEDFNQALCEQTLGEQEGSGSCGALIKELLSKNLFVQSVENEGTWLRYHHLFRDFLQHRFEELDSTGMEVLLERLTDIYQERGELEKGYAACQRLGQDQKLVSYVAAVSPALIHSGQLSLLKTWIDQLPRGLVDSNPALLSYRAAVAVMVGDPAGGLRMVNQVLEGPATLEDPVLEAELLIRRATCQRLSGNYSAGLEDASTALDLVSEVRGDSILEAEVEREIGLNQLRLGVNDVAKSHLTAALEGYENRADSKNAAYVQMDLGLLEMNVGNYPAARSFYRQAHQLWVDLGNYSQLVYLENNLGVLDHMAGDYLRAFSWFQKALDHAGRMSNLRGTAYTLASLGDLALDLGALGPAENYIYESRKISQKINDGFLQSYLEISRARLSRLRGETAAAEARLEDLALRIDPGLSGQIQGSFQLERALLCFDRGAGKKAADWLESAYQTFTDIRQPVEAGLAALLLAGQHCQEGDLPGAAEKLNDFQGTVQTLNTIQPFIPALSAQDELLDCLGKGLPGNVLIADLTCRVADFQNQLPEILDELASQQLLYETSRDPLLEIQGLGRICLKKRGELVIVREWAKQRTVRELLFYLLSCPEGVSREAICLEFWPDSQPELLQKQFKNALYRLRRAVGKESVVYDGTLRLYTFNRELDYRYDVEDFQQALSAAERVKDASRRIERLKDALEIYQHPFGPSLEGVWSEAVRYKLYLAYERAALELSGLQLAGGKVEDCLDTARKLLEVTPVQEEAWRLVMRAYRELGDRAGIKRAYQLCRETLAEALDAEPSPETETLYRTLMS